MCYESDLNTDYYSNTQKVEFAENVTEATQTIHLSEERIHVEITYSTAKYFRE